MSKEIRRQARRTVYYTGPNGDGRHLMFRAGVVRKAKYIEQREGVYRLLRASGLEAMPAGLSYEK
jgi:hypothetical protein